MRVVNIEKNPLNKIRGLTSYIIWFEHEGAVWSKDLEEIAVHDAVNRDEFKNWLNGLIEDTIDRTRHTKKKPVS